MTPQVGAIPFNTPPPPRGVNIISMEFLQLEWFSYDLEKWFR